MKDKVRHFFYNDFLYIILNYFVAYIPIWTVRKLMYKLLGVKIGKGSRIAMRCVMLGSPGIKIGNNTIINEYVLLDGRSKLTIGDNSSISMYSKLYSGTHRTSSNTFEYLGDETIIKDNCWIGTAAIVLPGSIVNDYSVVGANSVLHCITEEKGIYTGVPAQFVRMRSINKNYTLDYISYFR